MAGKWRNRRKAAGAFCAFLVVYSVWEGILALLFARLEIVSPYFFYKPGPTVTDRAIDNILSKRHPVLGWIPAKTELDPSGAFKTPSFPWPQPSCISLYGDSFTVGTEASSREKTWGQVLAHLMGCRVANFGSGGYGVDQSVLRFELNTSDDAPRVVLGVFVHDVLRNLTSNFGFISSSGDMEGEKPRFSLNAKGELELHPLANRPREELRDYLSHPDRFAPDDYFRWNGPEGAIQLKFPYTGILVKIFRNVRLWRALRQGLTGYPSWASFFEPGHPSRALELSVGIVNRFNGVAKTRGKEVLILVFPDLAALKYFEKTGVWAYQPLLDALTEQGIRGVNVGEEFIARKGTGGFSAFFKRPQANDTHYSDEGYRVVAALAARRFGK